MKYSLARKLNIIIINENYRVPFVSARFPQVADCVKNVYVPFCVLCLRSIEVEKRQFYIRRDVHLWNGLIVR